MEDIIIVIWVAMIILGSVINSVNKRRQKQIESEGEADEAQDLPQRPVIIRVPAPVSSEEARSIESESLESLEPETRWQQTKTLQQKNISHPQQHQKPIKHARPAKSTIKTGIKNSTNTSGKNIQHPLTEDFDLERAVIYSEILKPKYQEYE